MLRLWHKFENYGKASVTEWYGNYEYVFWGSYMQAESQDEPNRGLSHNKINDNMVARLSNQPFFLTPYFVFYY